MKKRIIAFALCVLMINTLIVYAKSAPLSESDDSKAFNVLSQLGFLPSNVLKNYKPTKPVTRGDFIGIASASFGYDKLGINPSQSFSDVTASNANYKAIMLCKEMRLINGDGSGRFLSSHKITLPEAEKIILTALGYEKIANVKGGYPNGYLVCANELDLLDGLESIDSKSNITLAYAIGMFYNAISIPVLSQSSYGTGKIGYSNKDGETILSQNHHINKYYGQLRGVYGCVMDDIDIMHENEVCINGEILKSNLPMKDLFGCNIYYYYNEDTDSIVAYSNETDDKDILKLQNEDIENYIDNAYSYYSGDKLVFAKISRKADVIYNGRAAGSIKNSEYIPKNGDVKLIKTDSDALYDVVVINDAQTFIIKKVDFEKEIFYDSYNKSLSFKNDDYDNVVFCDEFGENVYFDELNENDVISAVISRDQKYATLYYSNSEVVGKLDEKNVDQTKKTVCINGVEYMVNPCFEEKLSKLQLGYEGVFLLDVYGKIVGAAEDQSTIEKLGYLVALAKDKGLDAKYKIKIFSEDGKMISGNLSEYVVLDGERTKAENVYNTILNISQKRLIKYKMNGNDFSKIDTINETAKEGENSLNMLFEGYDNNLNESKNLQWNSYQKIFGSKFSLKHGIVIFKIPKDDVLNDKKYSIERESYFVQDHLYYVDAYRFGKKSHGASALVIYSDESTKQIDDTIELTLVDYVSKAIIDDEEGYIIHGLNMGDKKDFYVMDETILEELKSINPQTPNAVHPLSRGDIIKLKSNTETNIVTDIKLYYEKESDTIISNTAVGTEFSNSDRILRANVYSEDDGNLWLTQNPLSSSDVVLGMDEIESVDATLYHMYIYKSKTNTVEIATISDIIDYCSSTTNFTKIIMHSRYNDPGVIVIFN